MQVYSESLPKIHVHKSIFNQSHYCNFDFFVLFVFGHSDTEPTGTVISVGAHGGSSNPINQNQSTSLAISNKCQTVVILISQHPSVPMPISCLVTWTSSAFIPVAAVLASYLTVFRQLWSKATPVQMVAAQEIQCLIQVSRPMESCLFFPGHTMGQFCAICIPINPHQTF